MEKRNFLKKCCIEDSNMNKVLFGDPSQIISDQLRIPVWEIQYEFHTAHNTEKMKVKFILNYAESEWDGVEKEFDDYAREYNETSKDGSYIGGDVYTEFLGYLIIDLD